MARAFCLNALLPRSTSTTLALSSSTTDDMPARVLHRSPAVACDMREGARSCRGGFQTSPYKPRDDFRRGDPWVALHPPLRAERGRGITGHPKKRSRFLGTPARPLERRGRGPSSPDFARAHPDYTVSLPRGFDRRAIGAAGKNAILQARARGQFMRQDRSFRAALPPRARSPRCGGFRHFRHRPDRPLFTTPIFTSSPAKQARVGEMV